MKDSFFSSVSFRNDAKYPELFHFDSNYTKLLENSVVFVIHELLVKKEFFEANSETQTIGRYYENGIGSCMNGEIRSEI